MKSLLFFLFIALAPLFSHGQDYRVHYDGIEMHYEGCDNSLQKGIYLREDMPVTVFISVDFALVQVAKFDLEFVYHSFTSDGDEKNLYYKGVGEEWLIVHLDEFDDFVWAKVIDIDFCNRIEFYSKKAIKTKRI